MANEVLVEASCVYSDTVSPANGIQIPEFFASVATKIRTGPLKISVGTTERAIPLGDATAPGWAVFVNRDPTNTILLRVGTGGAKFAQMLPGEPAVLRLGPDAQVPYAIALGAPCILEYMICDT